MDGSLAVPHVVNPAARVNQLVIIPGRLLEPSLAVAHPAQPLTIVARAVRIVTDALTVRSPMIVSLALVTIVEVLRVNVNRCTRRLLRADLRAVVGLVDCLALHVGVGRVLCHARHWRRDRSILVVHTIGGSLAHDWLPVRGHARVLGRHWWLVLRLG